MLPRCAIIALRVHDTQLFASVPADPCTALVPNPPPDSHLIDAIRQTAPGIMSMERFNPILPRPGV